MIPGKIPDWMYPAIIGRFNIKFLLAFKLSNCACMGAWFPLLCKILMFIWWDSTDSALPHALDPCNQGLLFVVDHESSNNRKAISVGGWHIPLLCYVG